MAKLTNAQLTVELSTLRVAAQHHDQEVAALRTRITQLEAPKAPSTRPAKPPLTAHWSQRPVFYVAFDAEHAFKAREAAARRLNRVVMASPMEVATGRGTHTLWELR